MADKINIGTDSASDSEMMKKRKNHDTIPIPVALLLQRLMKTVGQLRGGEMRENKIIFTGPVGVGKTTAIAAISDEALVQTDASASDMTLDRKRNTTVAMDYVPSA